MAELKFLGRDGESHHETVNAYFSDGTNVLIVIWGKCEVVSPLKARQRLHEEMDRLSKQKIAFEIGVPSILDRIGEILDAIDKEFPHHCPIIEGDQFLAKSGAIITVLAQYRHLVYARSSTGAERILPKYVLWDQGQKIIPLTPTPFLNSQN